MFSVKANNIQKKTRNIILVKIEIISQECRVRSFSAINKRKQTQI